MVPLWTAIEPPIFKTRIALFPPAVQQKPPNVAIAPQHVVAAVVVAAVVVAIDFDCTTLIAQF